MQEYTYDELRRMQEKALERVRSMQQRAQQYVEEDNRAAQRRPQNTDGHRPPVQNVPAQNRQPQKKPPSGRIKMPLNLPENRDLTKICKICVPARTRRRSRKNCSISFPTTHQIYKAFCGALTSTACAMDGMLSPCKDEVCDISAPVATKTTRFNSPAVTRRRI